MNLALRSSLSKFAVRAGELVVGGRTVTELADEFGSPLYIYDRSIIVRQIRHLRDMLSDNLQIYYAVKANPNVEVIRITAGGCDGADVSSVGEMRRALEAGIKPECMSFSGPGKTGEDLRFAIEHGIGSISVESEQEIELTKYLCESSGTKANILLRINPPFELLQSGMKMGGGPSKFGIDSERVPGLMNRIRDCECLFLQGIHIFAGSQNLCAGELIRSFSRILEYSNSLSSMTDTHLKIVNMGGGFGIPYYHQDENLDISALCLGLNTLMDDYASRFMDTIFRIELGRFLVGESGIYLCRVLCRKISRNVVFLIVDGGLHHHLAASGCFGQSLIRRPMPVTVANRLDSPPEKANVTGLLCTPLDSFGYVEIPRAEEGDLIAVLNSGAYGLSASPVGFISHGLPQEIVV